MKNNERINYSKITDIIVKNKQCLSFALNKECTVLFVGQQFGIIQMYRFYNILKQIQKLKNHLDYVNCLICTRKSNSLISGSSDRQIIIWNLDQENQWKQLQILKGHRDSIRCIIINENEDLMISGGVDKRIIFWKQVKLNWNCQQIIDAIFSVYSMSLNPSQNEIIYCGYNKEQTNQQWFIAQSILVDEWGYRLCFINDDQFAFQSNSKEFLEIYNYQDYKFIKNQKVQVQYCKYCYGHFPSQFIKQQNTLIAKHGTQVNVFRIDLEGHFILQQSIEFGHRWLVGKLSDDGQFLITKDEASQRIQVRKLHYLQ